MTWAKWALAGIGVLELVAVLVMPPEWAVPLAAILFFPAFMLLVILDA